VLKQISVFVENRRGKMAEIMEVLATNGIDLRALSLSDTSEFGLLRIIASNPEKALEVLRNAGMMVRSNEVVAVGVSDTPGAFAKASRILADVGVNLEYLYALSSQRNDEAVIIMRLDQPGAGLAALRAGGFRIIDPEDIYCESEYKMN